MQNSPQEIKPKSQGEESQLLPLDHLFVSYGFKSSVMSQRLGLELNNNHADTRFLVNSKQETSVPGIMQLELL